MSKSIHNNCNLTLLVSLVAILMLLCAGSMARAIETPADGEPRIWNATSIDATGGEMGIPPTPGPLGAIKIVGTVNGTASGQVVVSGAKAVSAVMGTLATADGAKLPADAVTIRYAALQTDPTGGVYKFCNVLLDDPIAGAPVQPVWLTITVPADAKGGTYVGTLALTVDGKITPVPVEYVVSPWKLPNMRDGKSFLGMYQYIDAAANQYKVPMWSDPYWKLIEQEMKLMGCCGNDVWNVPAVAGTLACTSTSLIAFTKQGDDYVPDLTLFDKYAAIYDKNVGPPRVLSLHVWDGELENINWFVDKTKPNPLSVMISKDGTYAMGSMPFYGDPGTEKAWTATITAVRASMKKLGWDKTIVVFGKLNDGIPSARVRDFFAKVAPDTYWDMWSHHQPGPSTHGNAIGEKDGVRILLAGQPGGKGWSQPLVPVQGYAVLDGKHSVNTCSVRHNGLTTNGQPNLYRAAVDVSMRYQYECIGFNGIGFDLWQGRFGGGWFNLWRDNNQAVIAAGPKGPVSTVQYEAWIEGVQETEARIVIEDAIVGKTISAELSKKASDFMLERRAIRVTKKWEAGPNWQDITKRLFDLADEVTKAAKK